nr:hypothetical protein CFP56_32201 [Quercus suber]
MDNRRSGLLRHPLPDMVSSGESRNALDLEPGIFLPRADASALCNTLQLAPQVVFNFASRSFSLTRNMDSSAPLPPPGPNHNTGVLLVAWTPLPFATLVLLARIYGRTVRRNLGWDDGLMVLAWAAYLIDQIFCTINVYRNAFRHIAYIPPEQLPTTLGFFFGSQISAYWSTTLGKTSIALLFPRILERTSLRRKYVLYAHVILLWIITIVTMGVELGSCRPTRALWTPALILSGEAKCLSPEPNYIMTMVFCGKNVAIHVQKPGTHNSIAYSAYLDFFLAAFPISFIYNLRTSIQRRISLCALLGLGVIAGVFAILKTVQVPIYVRSTDITYASWSVYLWTGLELPTVIIAGSVPAAKAVWDRAFRGTPIADNDTANWSVWWQSLWSRLTLSRHSESLTSHDHAPLSVQSGNDILMKRSVIVSGVKGFATPPEEPYSDARWGIYVSSGPHPPRHHLPFIQRQECTTVRAYVHACALFFQYQVQSLTTTHAHLVEWLEVAKVMHISLARAGTLRDLHRATELDPGLTELPAAPSLRSASSPHSMLRRHSLNHSQTTSNVRTAGSDQAPARFA